MSDASGPLVPQPSVLAGVVRVGWRDHHWLARDPAILWGRRRGIYRPTSALRAMQNLGPVRHALSQRAISGILEVHAPFAPPSEK